VGQERRLFVQRERKAQIDELPHRARAGRRPARLCRDTRGDRLQEGAGGIAGCVAVELDTYPSAAADRVEVDHSGDVAA
jgi:hypothetical protein